MKLIKLVHKFHSICIYQAVLLNYSFIFHTWTQVAPQRILRVMFLWKYFSIHGISTRHGIFMKLGIPQDKMYTVHRYVAFPMQMFISVQLEICTYKLAQQYSFVTHVSLSILPSVCW